MAKSSGLKGRGKILIVAIILAFTVNTAAWAALGPGQSRVLPPPKVMCLA